MNAPQLFEDRLLVQLRRVVAEREDSRESTHRRTGRRRLVLSGAGAALVIAIVAIVAVAIGTGTERLVPTRSGTPWRQGGGLDLQARRREGPAAQPSAAGVPAVVDFEGTKAGPCVIAAGTNTSPEKAGDGNEANETRHLVQSESRVSPGTGPGAGEAGENTRSRCTPSRRKAPRT